MTTLNAARMLTRYNAWANRLIFDAVAALPEGEAVKPRKSLFKNIIHMLSHNYVIDRIFQAFIHKSDAELRETIRLLLRTTHNLAEGAGAASTAAAGKLREQLAGKTVVGILSGGNLDLRELSRILLV